MQRRWKTTLFFTLSLSFLFAPFLFAQSKQPPTQRWEYKTINCDSAELTKQGDDGWELVAVNSYMGSCNSYLLKRPKAANAPKYIDPQTLPAPKADAPACNLTLAQAPTIRGLRLGMTLEELSEIFPGVSLNELKLRVEKAAAYPSFGEVGYGFRGDQHKERLERIGFYVTLFDDRVRSYKVEYQFNNQASYGQVFSNEQIIDKLIENFKLPPKENWKSEYPGKASLNCQDFKLEVYAQSNTVISVEDKSQAYAEKIKQRQVQDAAKKQSEFKP